MLECGDEEVRAAVDTTRPSLLLRIRDQADMDAWRAFDAIYRPMLFRFARARGLSHADAEDVTQQCLSAIAAHMGRFDYDPRQGRFKSWLATLVSNQVRSLQRKRAERQGETGDFGGPQEREPGPDETFERIWLEEHLWHCLDELRGEVEESTFRAFEGYVIKQQPLAEVCTALNLTPANVYTIKWRMTERIAAKMKTLLDGSE